MTISNTLSKQTTLLALCIALTSTGVSAEVSGLPAVSGMNGKLGIQGAIKDGKEVGILSGALSIPLSHEFGLQLDGALDASGSIAGTGAHLFWRDPSQGLFGLYSDHMWAGDAEVSRIGLEAELYDGDFSLEGLIGYENAKINSDIFSRLALAYYPEDNMRVSIEHRYSNWQDGNWGAMGHSGALSAEYQLGDGSNQALSLFGEARFGEGHFDAFSLGLKIYFGDPKSLKRRHREDDPKTHIDVLGASESEDASPTTQQALTQADCMAMGPFTLFNGMCVPFIQVF